MESAQDPYKKWGIVLIIFLLVLIPGEIYLLKANKNISNLRGSSNQVALTNQINQSQDNSSPTKEASKTSQSKSFFIAIEYNPNSKIATKIGSGGFNGDSDELKTSPSSSTSKFSYKVETYSSSGQLLSSGWVSKSKFVIAEGNGKYHFRVYVPYVQGNTVKISLDNNEPLWSGQII